MWAEHSGQLRLCAYSVTADCKIDFVAAIYVMWHVHWVVESYE